MGEDHVDRKLPRNGLGYRVRVSGQHGHFDAELVQPTDGFRRLGTDGIRYGESGQHAIALQQVDDTLRLGNGLIGERRQWRLKTRVLPSQQIGPADEERSAATRWTISQKRATAASTPVLASADWRGPAIESRHLLLDCRGSGRQHCR